MPENTGKLADLMPLMKEHLAAGRSVQFVTHGTSMRPMLGDGTDEVILTRLTRKLKKYDLPLYQRDNGQFVLHRIVEAGETYTCVGDNQFQLEEGIRPDQMIAVVKGFIRKGKRYDVDDLSYRIYCRFWCWSRPIRRFGLWFYRGTSRRLKKIFGK